MVIINTLALPSPVDVNFFSIALSRVFSFSWHGLHTFLSLWDLLYRRCCCSLPRLLNRMYDNVLAKARASSIKSKLFDLALSKKMEEVERGIVRKDSLWDRLVFKKGMYIGFVTGDDWPTRSSSI